MAKKRSCRLTEEERKMHDRAVTVRKMTDAQLCDFIDRTYGSGMEEGMKMVEQRIKAEKASPVDGATYARAFVEYLADRIGSGNRIGNGTILQLRRELDAAERTGLFTGQHA